MQERLIKNKTLLTAIEPAISCTSLEVSADDNDDEYDIDDDADGVEDIDDDNDGVNDDDGGVDDDVEDIDDDIDVDGNIFQVLIGILQRRIELDKEVIGSVMS